MNEIDTIISFGGTFIMGGAMGFAMGYFLKKLLKFIVLILGGIIAFLAFLQYKGWISPHWNVIQKQTSDFARYAAQNTMATINGTAQEIAKHGLNALDVTYPLIGTVGFVPGLIIGFAKG